MENQCAENRSGQAENGEIEWSRTFRGTRMSEKPSPVPVRAQGEDVTPDIINAGINAILTRKDARVARHGAPARGSEIAGDESRVAKAPGGVSRIPMSGLRNRHSPERRDRFNENLPRRGMHRRPRLRLRVSFCKRNDGFEAEIAPAIFFEPVATLPGYYRGVAAYLADYFVFYGLFRPWCAPCRAGGRHWERRDGPGREIARCR